MKYFKNIVLKLYQYQKKKYEIYFKGFFSDYKKIFIPLFQLRYENKKAAFFFLIDIS